MLPCLLGCQVCVFGLIHVSNHLQLSLKKGIESLNLKLMNVTGSSWFGFDVSTMKRHAHVNPAPSYQISVFNNRHLLCILVNTFS